jgi:hypothetical protein
MPFGASWHDGTSRAGFQRTFPWRSGNIGILSRNEGAAQSLGQQLGNRAHYPARSPYQECIVDDGDPAQRPTAERGEQPKIIQAGGYNPTRFRLRQANVDQRASEGKSCPPGWKARTCVVIKDDEEFLGAIRPERFP